MKPKLKSTILRLVLSPILAQVVWAQTMGSAFTYQGRLTEAGQPAQGVYGMVFELYDALEGGTQLDIYPPSGMLPVTVESGLFTVTIEFDATHFDGQARWLAITVNGVTLSPRQELTPTPYALYAQAAEDSNTVSGYEVGNASGQVPISNGTLCVDLNADKLDGLDADDFLSTANDYGRQGVATDLYEGSETLSVRYVDATGPDSMSASDSMPTLSVTNDGTGHAVSAAATGTGDVENVGGYFQSAGDLGAGVYGEASGTDASGVKGYAAGINGTGVFGGAQGAGGIGVRGVAADPLGINFGVYGETVSPNGYAGYFLGRGYFSDNVGIGTTSPAQRLTISSPDENTLGLTGPGQYGEGARISFGTGGGPLIYNGFYGGLEINTNPAMGAVLALTGGYVGVGTSTPSQRLEVAGDALVVGQDGWSTAGDEAPLYLGDTNHSIRAVQGQGVCLSTLGAPDAICIQQGTGNVGVGTSTPQANLHVDGSAAFPNGNVGIGTTAPVSPLHVTGAYSDPNENSGLVTVVNTVPGEERTPAIYAKQTSDLYGAAVEAVGGWSAINCVGERYGIRAEATGLYYGGTGVYGWADGPADAVGVQGSASGPSEAYGVYGWADGDEYSYAIYGSTFASSGVVWAGYFSGNVMVTGLLSKGGGSFKIDHPLDPENKYLYHSFVESPDMMNIYNGNVTTDANGYAIVTLPEWFETVNRDFRYQLTVIGQFAQAIVAEEIRDNRFAIRTDKPNVKVSWQVTGIRQDPWANAHRIPVEEDKPERERGLYLHPELYGQPETQAVSYRHRQGPERPTAPRRQRQH